MNDRMNIDLFQQLIKTDGEENELLVAIRNLMAVRDPESLSQSIKTAPPAFGSWSGWSY
jgi:hypothetical protein